MTIDGAGGKLYWTEPREGKILRANLDGSALEVVGSGFGHPILPSRIGPGRKLTWVDMPGQRGRRGYSRVDNADLRIYRANLDGSALEVVRETSSEEFLASLFRGDVSSEYYPKNESLAFHPATERIYWPHPRKPDEQRCGPHEVRYTPLRQSSTDRTAFAFAPSSLSAFGISAMAVDEHGSRIYVAVPWTTITRDGTCDDTAIGPIRSSALDGTDERVLTSISEKYREVLSKGADEISTIPQNLYIDQSAGRLYWNEDVIEYFAGGDESRSYHRQWMANLDGSDIQMLATSDPGDQFGPIVQYRGRVGWWVNDSWDTLKLVTRKEGEAGATLEIGRFETVERYYDWNYGWTETRKGAAYDDRDGQWYVGGGKLDDLAIYAGVLNGPATRVRMPVLDYLAGIEIAEGRIWIATAGPQGEVDGRGEARIITYTIPGFHDERVIIQGEDASNIRFQNAPYTERDSLALLPKRISDFKLTGFLPPLTMPYP